VIAEGETRDAAIGRLDAALAGTVILGVKTNVGFLRDLLALDDFRAGRVATDLIDRQGEAFFARPEPPDEALASAARARSPSATPSPWRDLAGLRLSEPPRIDAERLARAVSVRAGARSLVALDGRTYEIEPGEVRHDGHHHEPDDPFAASPMTGVVAKVAAKPGAKAKKGAELFVVEAMKMEYVVRAPRDVTVQEVRRKAGDRVALGDVVVTFAEAP
jgi:acetyl-CoA/propionyl-CoA carboxylase biotin carboxyl carrier protein